MRRTTCCRGTYSRSGPDLWFYPWGEPVPDGRDLTVRTALRRAGRPRPAELTAAVLTWACALQDVVAPVAARGEDPFDLVIGLDAPELATDRLLGLGDLAALLGESRATVDSLVVRGQLPSHQLVADGARRWARPVVDHGVARWMEVAR